MTLATAFGKVRLDRQRLFCTRCRRWLTPLNEVLGLHQDGNGRTTRGFRELSCLCGAHQPYRHAHRMLSLITQDVAVSSAKQIERIVDQEGHRIRMDEAQRYEPTSARVLRDFQDRNPPPPRREGTLYICVDGVWVRSHPGKRRWREGKVGFLCTDLREPVGCQGRQRVVDARYVSSFEPARCFADRVYVEGVRMGYGAYDKVIVLGDGARWIRALQRNSFPRALYILDWYHLRRKISRVFRRVFAEQEPRRSAWYEEITTDLWEGRKVAALRKLQLLGVELISPPTPEPAKRQALQELLTYLKGNWEGIIPYAAMRDAGYMVASSLVEKAGDLVIAKRQKKHQGMHWGHLGADAVSALRTLWLNGDWQNHWGACPQAA